MFHDLFPLITKGWSLLIVELHGVPPHCSFVTTYLVLVWAPPHTREHELQLDQDDNWQSTRLPVKERIIFKILLVTYEVLHGFAPAYLNDLLFNYTPHRLLRSSSLNLLSIPKAKTVTYGDRSFSVIAPKLWNDLPIVVKQCSTVDSY